MHRDPHQLCQEYAVRIEQVHAQARHEGISNPIVLVFQGVRQASRDGGGNLPQSSWISSLRGRTETCSIFAVPHDTELMNWVGLPDEIVGQLSQSAQDDCFYAVVVGKWDVSVVEFRTIPIDFFPFGFDCMNRHPLSGCSPI